MAKSQVVSGSLLQLYINGNLYPEVQQISWTINYGEEAIYGIDSLFPQEIMAGRVSVNGVISGIKLKYVGGLQGRGALPLIRDIAKAPYISIRVMDKTTGEDLIFIPEAKVSSQNTGVSTKSTVRVSFNFTGMVPFETIDSANG